MTHAGQAVRTIFAILTVPAIAGLLAAQDTKPFPAPPSAGQAIQQAARASLPAYKNIEILSDTEGVDFGPDLQDLVATIREHWYSLIPEDVQTKKGKLTIQFRILKSGEISGMTMAASSGSAALDRPAWGSITASGPLKPLPDTFLGPYLALRFHFFYNPDGSDLEASDQPHPGLLAPKSSIQHAVLVQATADSHPIKYPKKAIRGKKDGVVRLSVTVAADGKVESVLSDEGSLLLWDAASQAIRKWRFQPARQDGKPVKEQIRIRVEFRLDGQSVQAKIVSPEPIS